LLEHAAGATRAVATAVAIDEPRTNKEREDGRSTIGACAR
jgi:hypothetical protein